MSFNPCRQRGSAAGIHARRRAADAHRGTRHDFLRRHEMDATEAARGSLVAKRAFASKLLKWIADHRNLHAALDYLASECGQGAGPDGLTYTDLADWDNWELVRTLSKAILNGTYRPGPDRIQWIKKTSGNGDRILRYPSVIDRVVQRAVVQVLQPFLDPMFDPLSFGYRPRRGVNHAVAHAERLAVDHGNWVWVTEDLKDAFDAVPQERLLQVMRKHVPDDGTMALLERLIRTESGRGLRQGGNLSPFLMNAYLDHVLDQPWRKRNPGQPQLRWADDSLIQCSGRTNAILRHQRLDELVRPAGMKLKGSPGSTIFDLGAGDSADWLGYRISRAEDRLRIVVREKSWDDLTDELKLCQTKHDSQLRAIRVIRGWVVFLGPCYPWMDVPGTYARISRLCSEQAFHEVPSLGVFSEWWTKAHERWEILRRALLAV